MKCLFVITCCEHDVCFYEVFCHFRKSSNFLIFVCIQRRVVTKVVEGSTRSNPAVVIPGKSFENEAKNEHGMPVTENSNKLFEVFQNFVGCTRSNAVVGDEHATNRNLKGFSVTRTTDKENNDNF
jgi:hypothetical protein